MSLQIWLPLNGNLNNQGLSNLQFQLVNSTNTTINDNGKIGKCYNNNSNTAGGIVSTSKISLGQQHSMFCWFKFSSLMSNSSLGGTLVSTHYHSGNYGTGITIRYVSSTTGYLSVNTGNGSSRTYNTYYGTTLLQADTWYHGGFTYDGTNIKIYVNGKLEKTQSYANMSMPENYIGLFIWSLNSQTPHNNYKLDGYLNDVRIYDHCLSVKEVEEISKGLILHYKLDQLANINNNLYTGSKNFSGTWVNGSAWSTSPETYNGFTVKQRSNTWGGLAQNIPATNGDIFTISFWAKVDSGGNILSVHRSNLGNVVTGLTILDGNFSSGDDWVVTTIDGTQWKRYWGTLRIDSTEITYLQWRIENSVANKNLYIAGLTLEKGYGTKVWSPSASENDSIGKIYDSSGYENHGISISSPTLSNNTIRYKNSLLFDGIDDAIQFPYNQINPSGIFTVNLWFYKSELGSKNYETLFGGPSGFEMDTRSGSSTTLSLYMASVRGGNVFSPFALNTWYMITMIRDGINELYYVNGNLVKTIEAKSMPTGTYYIGAWNVSTSQNYKGNISDFRLYATVLTEEQIKELYNTSATIDNNGNIYSRGFIENDSLNITKTGLFQTSIIEDDNNGQASIFKTKKILGTNLYEY